MLFISGCASFSNLGDLFKNLPFANPVSSGGGKSFAGGKASITVTIVQPPESGKISRELPLVVNLLLKDDGEAQADGQACVTGLDSSVFSGSESCKCEEFSLEGKAKSDEGVAEGEDKTITFDEGVPTLDEFTINDFSVTSIVRYNYKTFASVEGCVKKDMLNSKDCKTSQAAKIIGVSSAPLQITSVSQELLSTSDKEYTMSLFIEVSHVGNGQFFDTSLDKNACNEDSENINKKVDVRLYNAPGTASCSPLTLKKNEDKGTAICTITGVSARDYKPLMNIELSYAYEIRESNNFQVA